MEKGVFMPKLGMTMDEGKILEWKAAEGDWVEKGQVVLVLETEKVAYELEAEDSGFLIILAQLEEVYPCGEALGLLAETKEVLEKLKKERPRPVKREEEVREPQPSEAVQETGTPEPAVAQETATAAPDQKPGRIKIAPLARRIAEKHGLDIAQIPGSGPGGRIVKADVEKALAEPKPAAKTATAAPAAAASAGDRIGGKLVKHSIPYSGVRKTMGEAMLRSKVTKPHGYQICEADASRLIKFREDLLEKENEIGARITYTDIAILIIAKALKHVPIINSSIVGNEIKIWEDINVGFAIATSKGENETVLLVPNIKNADKKSISEICLERIDLTKKGKENKLTVEDMSAGTFTLSSAGMFAKNWTVGTTIINGVESSILGMPAIVEKPVVKDGQIVAGKVLPLVMSYDHRHIDGMPAVKFMTKVVELIEKPELALM
jgi:pyruvate dehydrogenase E2 component (dihydrolipoamide acetyltransferase)